MTIWSPGKISFSQYFCAGCPGVPNTGIGYVVASDLISGSPTSNLTINKINVNAGFQGSTLIATIHPADVVGSWSEIEQNGLCVDQTDGHILLFVSGSSGVGSANYMLKVDHTTGAIIWQLSMLVGGGGNIVAQSRVKNQQFAVVQSLGGGTNKCTVINTNTGAVSFSFTTGMDGFTPFGDQCYDDTTGAIVGEFAYSGGANSPIPLNGTTAFTGWGALYVTAALNPNPATGTHASYVRIWGNMPR
jgi:hypothetical protein